MKTDDEDKKTLEAYESGNFRSVPNAKRTARYRDYAKSTLQKNKRINIRISERSDAYQRSDRRPRIRR